MPGCTISAACAGRGIAPLERQDSKWPNGRRAMHTPAPTLCTPQTHSLTQCRAHKDSDSQSPISCVRLSRWPSCPLVTHTYICRYVYILARHMSTFCIGRSKSSGMTTTLNPKCLPSLRMSPRRACRTQQRPQQPRRLRLLREVRPLVHPQPGASRLPRPCLSPQSLTAADTVHVRCSSV